MNRSFQQGAGLGQADLPHELVIFVLEDGTTIEGQVTIPRRGARLSDWVSQADRDFFTVSAAKIISPEGNSEAAEFVMIARRFVKLLKPLQPSSDAS